MYKRHKLTNNDGSHVKSGGGDNRGAVDNRPGTDGAGEAQIQNRKWTQEERDAFHEAYQKHGKQLELFVPLIPSRTLKQIKAFYGMYKRYKLTPKDGTDAAIRKPGNPSGTQDLSSSSANKSRKSHKKEREADGKNSGKWSKEEKAAFHRAYVAHGRKFKRFEAYLPKRTLPQIQSYYATYERQKKRNSNKATKVSAAAKVSLRGKDEDQWTEEEKVALELMGFANHKASE